VDHIYITENDVTVPQAMQDTLRPFVEDGFLRLEAWGDSEPAQMKIYDNCFKNIKDKYEWVALFDADEYLMVLEECARPSCLLYMGLTPNSLQSTYFVLSASLLAASIRKAVWCHRECHVRPIIFSVCTIQGLVQPVLWAAKASGFWYAVLDTSHTECSCNFSVCHGHPVQRCCRSCFLTALWHGLALMPAALRVM
jgi:hypothetical protein